MREDAHEAFYTKACFEFDETPEDILFFFRQLPTKALGFVRSILFRIEPRQFFRWDNDNYLEQWQNLTLFIKDNFNVSNLSITIDSEVMYDHCIWARELDDNRYYYEVSRQIADTMCMLRGIHDIHFRLA
jgi:hypothetical protein